MGTSQPPTTSQRLDSWKEIAAFFGRDQRTVKRWEKDRALPVRRYPGSSRGRVYAYPEDLCRWMNAPAVLDAEPTAGATEGSPEAGPKARGALEFKKRTVWLVALVVLTGLAVAAGLRYGRMRNATPSSAAAVPNLPAADVPHRSEAEELYLEGRYYWNKRTPDSLNMAVDYFTQAIVRDPNYAPAYVGLADCYNLLREFTVMPASEAFARAIAAARRGVELDDNSAAAHASLAFVTFYGDWNAREAERHFQRAIALNPNYASAHHWHATFLMTMGRFPEALAEIDRAQQLEPASPAILADKGLILFLAGQAQPAEELLKQLEASEPTFLSPHRYLGEVYLSSKRNHDYLAEEQRAAELAHDDAGMDVIKAGERGLATGGERAMLLKILEEQKKLRAANRVSSFQLARTCALLGARREALTYLQSSYTAHESELLALRNDLALRSLRSDASFRELVARTGLPGLN